jgi:hypothetical protein
VGSTLLQGKHAESPQAILEKGDNMRSAVAEADSKLQMQKTRAQIAQRELELELEALG